MVFFGKKKKSFQNFGKKLMAQKLKKLLNAHHFFQK